MDHNDLYQQEGPDAVKAQFDEVLDQPPLDPPPKPVDIVRAAIEKARDGDPGAPFGPDVIAAAKEVYVNDLAGFMRLRSDLKAACKDVLITAWHAQVRSGFTADDEKTIADEIVDVIAGRVDLFHDKDGEPYAAFDNEGVRQTHAVWSKGFRELVGFIIYRELGLAPSEQVLKTALNTLAGKAKFDGDERPVYLRVAFHDGAMWIDLCDAEWRAIKVTRDGWEIVKNPPVHFRRTSSMRPLPTPVYGGKVDTLWEIVNVPMEDRLLVLAVMLECYRANTPYPVLELVGEQGSAKSSTQFYLRELIDPNMANNRAAPNTVEDLFVAAQNSHVISLENMSQMVAAFQDGVCVLSTGGGHAKRELYSNYDESVVSFMKPVILNGIATIATRQDLADRTVHCDLAPIMHRFTAGEIAKKFEAERNGIFGGLMDQLVAALKILPSVVTEDLELPRMADFALLGEAVYRVNGEAPGAFLAYYSGKRTETVHRTLDSSPVGAAALSYLEKHQLGFEGTVKGLMEALAPFRPNGEGWPHSPRGFADAFRRVAPALRMVGVTATIATKPGRDGYRCVLMRAVKSASLPVQNSSDDVHQVHKVHAARMHDRVGEHGEHGERGDQNNPAENMTLDGDIVEGTL